MTKCNGHPSRTHWNVALWINNDEPLYRAAVDCAKRHRTCGAAARELMRSLPERTPDGYRYSFPALRAAIRGLKESL